MSAFASSTDISTGAKESSPCAGNALPTIENLDQIIAAVQSHVRMQTFTLGDDGEKETSSAISYMIGIVMMMILYMFILMYGQMVMTSIIEEKANRVLEVVVSSVKPYTLLMGKLLGIGCVALTQILIWAFIILAFSDLPSGNAEGHS